MFSKGTAVRILTIGFFLCEIPAIFLWSNGKYATLPLFVWWCMYALILYSMIRLSPKEYVVKPIRFWMYLLLLSIFNGFIYHAENYWDYKSLIVNFWIFSMPIAVYAYAKPIVVRNVLSFWFKYSWILMITLLPLVNSAWYGRLFVPYTFLSLFFTILPQKQKLWVIGVFLFLLIFSISARADIMRFAFALMIGLFFSTHFVIKHSDKLLRVLTNAFLFLPIVLFALGSLNVFNIFNIQEELDLREGFYVEDSSGSEENLMADSRTFIYEECIESAIRHDYVIWGRSIARGYESAFFSFTDDNLAAAGRGRERQSSEVGIMNIFTYFGIVGCILYFIIFLTASHTAVYKSNNYYVPIVGVYIAFKWMLSWIEEYTMYELNLIILWIMIAICYSPFFRKMTNEEFKVWVKSLFIRK